MMRGLSGSIGASALVCLMAFLTFAPLGAQTQEAAPNAPQLCQETQITIRTQGGEQSFTIEIADTLESRARGLMHRTHLPADAGMLFIYETPQPVAFWMRNTLIALDMIFIDRYGRIRSIHENAVPLDETAIPGGDNIRFVLEVNGGITRALGIKPGDLIRHPSLGRDALLPCT